MLKKFADGLIFGSGFAIAFVVILYLGLAFFIIPKAINKSIPSSISPDSQLFSNSSLASEGTPKISFNELDIDQKIENSSIIAIVKFEPSADGKKKAIISEFLKKDANTIFYYNIGDEYKSSSFYSSENTDYGDGLVIFFTGSPAEMKMSMSYSGDRILALGDLPIELFRNKCK